MTTFIIRDFAKQSQLRITAHILLYALSVFIKGAQNKMQSHALSFSLIDRRFCRWKPTLLPSRCQLIPCILFRSLVKKTDSGVIFDARLAEFAMASFCNVPEANVCLKMDPEIRYEQMENKETMWQTISFLIKIGGC